VLLLMMSVCLPGRQVVQQQLADGVPIRRVGFISSGAPARQHSEITTPEGEVIGEVTSGAFSPCLKKNIAMG
jgi:aminomethyltransferase